MNRDECLESPPNQDHECDHKDHEEDPNDHVIESHGSFETMGLEENLLRGVYAHGFQKPSSIQQKAIVPFIQMNEIIAQAQSGTGKTGTFSIGLLQLVNNDVNCVQAIILTPTRELANQITKIVNALGIYKKIKAHTCVGGTDWRRDVEILRSGEIRIVVGTPGRVYDMLKRGAIDGNRVEHIVLDEADEMLDMQGFQEIVHDIFVELPQNIHIGLFSATMPPAVLEITKAFMKNPVKIIVKAEELTLEGIRQFYIPLEDDYQKLDVLCDLYSDISISSSVIFCNSKNRVDQLVYDMSQRDFAVSGIHGSLSSDERKNIMNQFRAGNIRVLITTDLLARGIDVHTVNIVINYDLPRSLENYIHRIGRSGRFGRKGLAINLVTERYAHDLKEIERFYNTQIDELPANINELVG